MSLANKAALRERGVVAVLGQRGHGVVDGAREQCFGHFHREQVNVLGRPVRQSVLANSARPGKSEPVLLSDAEDDRGHAGSPGWAWLGRGQPGKAFIPRVAASLGQSERGQTRESKLALS